MVERPIASVRPRRSRLRATYFTHLAPIIFLLPAAILFSVFVLFPIGASISLAFYEWNGIGPRTWVGLANFRRLLADPVFQTALFNNLTWLACIGAAPLLGLGLALM